ncbi:MAG TPA: hypothetical protein VGM76_01405 [Lacipirellulaceae bacterium]
MSCRQMWSSFLAVLFGAIGLTSYAFSSPITYVDATDGAAGNTALAAGGTWTAASVRDTDGHWAKRTGLANGSTVFESNGNASALPGEDAERLVTTISGLTPGQSYNLYAFFWSPDDNAQQWMFRASKTNPASGDLPSYSRSYNDAVNNAGGVVLASNVPITPDFVAPFPAPTATDFANSPLLSESGRFMWIANVGTGVADGSGNAKVYVDDYVLSGLAPPDGNNTTNHRTWFDGVGYSAAVPEPTSIALVAMAVVTLPVLRRLRSRR